MTDQPDFIIKKLRCEWQVVIQEVDQYWRDVTGGHGYHEILSVWPTYELARNDIPNHGHETANGKWFPNSFPGSAYHVLTVKYTEVRID